MWAEHENALAGVRAPARAAGKGLPTTDSQRYYSTPLRKTPSISDLLQTGAENGTMLRELVAMTGMDERSVRLQIQRERKAGRLILSDNRSGYFLPENPVDVQRFARSMSRRAAEIAGIARAAENALADMIGQTTVVGWRDG